MATRISSSIQNLILDTVGAEANSGKVQLVSGERPTNVTDAPGGDVLAEFDLEDPAFTSASGGEMELEGTILETQGTAEAGTGEEVGFMRVLDSSDNPLWDNDNVGTSSSNNTVVVNTDVISEGVTVELISMTVNQPAS